MELYWIDLVRLLAAVVAGALIGLERELADKPAGLRTNILICLGAAVFALLSVRLAEGDSIADRTRIAAQVVTGVGFLGAGAIIQHHSNVTGLTTAATIWAVASVGMAFGVGEFVLGILGTGLTAGVLFGLGFAEASISRWWTVGRFELKLDPTSDMRELIDELARRAEVRWKPLAVEKTGECLSGRIKAVGSAARVREFQRALMKESRIRGLKRL